MKALMPVVESRGKASPAKRGYTREYRTRRARVLPKLLAKQRGLCAICAKPLDSGLRWPDPLSVSLDHITTVRGPGFNAVSNFRAAHLRCNSSRGARERDGGVG